MRKWIVAATGPSLTRDVAAHCRAAQRRGWQVLAVNDAWRMVPSAEALYAHDTAWWSHHKGAPGFAGARWSATSDLAARDGKRELAKAYGINLVHGSFGAGFSHGPGIHYGGDDHEQSCHSGFQAVNLALLWGARRIVLVGFDLRKVEGRSHFFGDHPRTMNFASPYARFAAALANARPTLPAGVDLINATPGSALKAYPMMTLRDALADLEALAA